MFPMPAGVASAIGGQMSPKPEPGWIDMVRQIGLGLAMTNDFGKGIGMGVQNMQAAEKKRGLASALKGMAGSLPENQRAIVAQLSDLDPEALLQPLMANAFKPKEEAGGPFAGTSMDAQIGNILVAGEQNPALKQTPQYKFAVAQYTQPRITMGPDGRVVTVQPTLPNFGGSQMPQVAPSPLGQPTPQPQGQLSRGPRQTSVPGANVSVVEAPLENRTLPGFAQKTEDDLMDQLRTAQGINSRMSFYEKEIKDGRLPLGMLSNFEARARNQIGYSTPESVNFATFNSELEAMRNASLRLNSGVQTEGDAQRAWNELVANVNDPKVVQAQLQRIKALNERAAKIKQQQLQLNRSRNRVAPLDPGVLAPIDGAQGAPSPALQPAVTPKAAATADPTVQDAIAKARAAVANGKDPAAVAQRLREFGIDPSEAGLQ